MVEFQGLEIEKIACEIRYLKAVLNTRQNYSSTVEKIW
jgi:hypothetical protein